MSLPSPGPLLPPEEGRDGLLAVVIASLSLLAVLALMLVLSTDRAAGGWTRAVSGEMTVLVSPRAEETGADAAARAAQTLAAVAGVSEAAALPREEAEALLRPWLGESLPADLPLPHLVTVTLDPDQPADPQALRRALAQTGIRATVDDHSLWRGDVARSARLVRGLGGLAAVLTVLASVAAVAFAVRAGVRGRAELMAVLSLSGASDGHIAGLFQRRYGLVVLAASAGGTALALLLAALLMAAGAGQGSLAAVPLRLPDLLVVSPWPLLTATLAVVTARLMVLGLLAIGRRRSLAG